MSYFAYYQSFVGRLTLASDGDSLLGIWYDGQKYFGCKGLQDFSVRPDLPVFVAARKWLDRYFRGDRPAADALPLAPQGGEFRQAVWGILREIPYGECVAYGSIAKTLASRLGRKSMSSQAVGGAIGHNPISILIPCHRVIGADCRLTGYAGGIDRKRLLLEHEGVRVLFRNRSWYGEMKK